MFETIMTTFKLAWRW